MARFRAIPRIQKLVGTPTRAGQAGFPFRRLGRKPMKVSIRHALAAAVALAFCGSVADAATFTYHGNLNDGGEPADGRYDLRITLYGSERAAVPLADAATVYGVEVHDGAFSTEVDFASNPPQEGWIGVAVRKAGEGDFVDLAGRTAIAGADACWSTMGNIGLAPGSYIGTLDDTPLLMRVNDHFGAELRSYSSGDVSFEVGKATATGIRSAALNWGLAAATDSFAGGYSGQVVSGHDRSFVWGGTNRVERVSSTGADQFDVWADGGFIVNSSALGGDFNDFVIYPRGGAGSDADTDLVLFSRNGKKATFYISDTGGILHVSASNGVHIENPVEIAESLKVDGSASKSTAGAWKANSDGRIKQDIVPVENALDTLAKVRPVSFRYTDAYRADHPDVADQRYYNVIAQEFAEVFPDAVTKSGEYLPGTDHNSENEILQVDTYPAQIVTIAAVQELAQKNAALEATVQQLMKRIARLESSKGK
jgi:hypothetical protein